MNSQSRYRKASIGVGALAFLLALGSAADVAMALMPDARVDGKCMTGGPNPDPVNTCVNVWARP